MLGYNGFNLETISEEGLWPEVSMIEHQFLEGIANRDYIVSYLPDQGFFEGSLLEFNNIL